MQIYVHRNNQQSGPFDDSVIVEQLRRGALSPDDMGCPVGASAWQRLGDLFPQVVSAPLPETPETKKGGCLRSVLVGLGSLAIVLGILAVVGSRFIPSPSCDLAESDARKIEKLRSDLDRAKTTSDFDKIGPLTLELNRELSGASTTQRYCNDDKFRNNVITGTGVAAGFVGLLMLIIGMVIGRRK